MSQLQIAAATDFDKIFSIMEASFPPDEYRTYAGQKALFDNPYYTAYVLQDTTEECFKAFISVWKFEDFAYIEHFAVNERYRNEGLGSLILQEISHLLPCKLCLEVELPETDFARRRIGFYERNGFFTNDYPYTQPAYSSEKHELPLIIMTSGSSVSEDAFTEIKRTIYKEVYNREI